MPVIVKDEIKLIIGLFLFMFIFYNITMKKNKEDIRRKELRMKYYL